MLRIHKQLIISIKLFYVFTSKSPADSQRKLIRYSYQQCN
ncbi:MAG: hypothetical protein JWQ38_1065 [Flavipsychrobacter sp.]|nr:hypothetical protein [Flavipsychrobacter sp.]